ncbi:MAG: DNA N-6-adenine-methyltransferase [Leuconostoc falkenbergense]|uniref:DNA N-6-adenine-methyltransferase n=1 Tax=Leuconostoc falkenbergense TaxID=2766470 RepID=UPI0039EB4697
MGNFFNPSGAALTSNKDDWETPALLFKNLNEKYSFDLDAAASDENHKVDNYFTANNDALKQKWGGNVFVNPPYGRNIRAWVEKAHQESVRDPNRKIVMLIPSRTDTSYWHDFIFPHADIEFIRGRFKFEINGHAGNPAPFPSAIVVFGEEVKL